MERYDDHLQFDLKPGYEVRRGKNDDGSEFFRVLFGVSRNEEGEETSEATVNISCRDELTIEDEKVNLQGNFRASLLCTAKETQVLFAKLNLLITVIAVAHKGHGYIINCNGVARGDDGLQKRAELSARHLSAVLSSMVLDGEKADFQEITAETIFERIKAQAEQEAAEEANGPFPRAVPGENQHSQLDFQTRTRSSLGLFGNFMQVNATGTEYSFENLQEHVEYMEPGVERQVLLKAVSLNTEFALAEQAKEMSRLFRVDIDFFDAAHDREQEILSGLIQRAVTYNGLRSFAWTLSAYCAANHTTPEKVSIETLRQLTAYLEEKEWLNYKEDDNCPTLCGGDDIHLYYLPDALPEQEKKRLQDKHNAETENSGNVIMSLDGLRKDLTYIYPAVKTLYDALAEERDPEMALEGNEADVLYAWCSMTYAARGPIYTEDGPMNNWFRHPDEEALWEAKWRKEREEREKKAAEEWMKTNGKHLTRNPRINFSGAKFVFAGVEGRDDWTEILEKLTKRGALHRGAVSGQTDYLVCDPRVCGDSKVKAALSQNIKGKHVKIILLEDLLKALGMQQKQEKEEAVPEEKPAPVVAKPVKKEKAEVDLSGMTTVTLTYTQGLTAGNDDYEIDIPDGFRIKKNAEDRDFIAWLPSEADPDDYSESSFILYAGSASKGNDFRMATTAEFVALAHMAMLGASASGMFEKNEFIPCEDPALPGGIILAYDGSAVHANAYLGVSDYSKGMRLLIDQVEKKDRPAYEKLVKDFFGRMRAKKPVQLIREPDDKYFEENALTPALAKEWDTCIEEQIQHISLYRAILQNGYVSRFQKLQQRGEGSVVRLKKEIKDVLRDAVERMETQIGKAETIYRKISAANPTDKTLLSLRASMVKLLDAADQSVELDKQELKVESALAKTVRARLDTPEIAKMKKEEEQERQRREAAERKRIAEEKAKQEAERKEAERKERNYQTALKYMRSDDDEVVAKAVPLLKDLGDYKEAAQKLEKCPARIEELKKAKEQRRLEEERKAEEKRRREEEERRRKEEEERQRKLAEEERIRKKKAKQKKFLIRTSIIAGLLLLAYLATLIVPAVLRANGKMEPEFTPEKLTEAQAYVDEAVDDYWIRSGKELKAARVMFTDDLKEQLKAAVDVKAWDISQVKAAVVFYVGPEDYSATTGKNKWELKPEEPIMLELGEGWYPVLYLMDGEKNVVYQYEPGDESNVDAGIVDTVGSLDDLRLSLAQAELEKENYAEKYAKQLGDYAAVVEQKMQENPDYLYTLECWIDCNAEGRTNRNCYSYAGLCRTAYLLERRLAALGNVSAGDADVISWILTFDEQLLNSKVRVFENYYALYTKKSALEKSKAEEIAPVQALVASLKEQSGYFFDEALMRASLANDSARQYNVYLRQEEIYLKELAAIDQTMACRDYDERIYLQARNKLVVEGFSDYGNALMEHMQCVLNLEKFEADNAASFDAYEKEKAAAKENGGANYEQSIDYLKVQLKYESMLKEQANLQSAVEKAKAAADKVLAETERKVAEEDADEADRLTAIAIQEEKAATREYLLKEVPLVSEYDAQKGQWGLLHKDYVAYQNGDF